MSPRPRLDHVRRPELLAAAAAVIRERGVESARVADVAERAGTSAPAVLYWFASKAELLDEALCAAEENYYAELEAELRTLPDARERLVRVIESATGGGDYDAALWMELWAKALRDDALAATRRELDRRWRETIAGIVREGQAAGEFGPADPDDLALVLCSLLDGLAVQIAHADPDGTPERARALCLRLAGGELGLDLTASGAEVAR